MKNKILEYKAGVVEWSVFRNGYGWSDGFRSEEECENHIINTIEKFGGVEEDYTYRLVKVEGYGEIMAYFNAKREGLVKSVNNKIVILCGESSTGKDTILNKLVSKYNWHKAISYTTRPMREGEKDGYDYHFLASNKQFNHLMDTGHMFEKTEYRTNMGLWLYGLGEDSFVDDEINICIVNPHGLDQLLEIKSLKDRIQVLYITADFDQRFFRYLNRDSDEDKHKIELVDRFVRDESDFKNFVRKSIGKYNCLTIKNNDGTDVDSLIRGVYSWVTVDEK